MSNKRFPTRDAWPNVAVQVAKHMLLSGQIVEKESAYPNCKGCEKCCGCSIPTNGEEIRRIKKFIKENGIEPINHDDNTCPLFDYEKGCMVYEVRPYVCRQYTCARQGTKEELLDYDFFLYMHTHNIKEVDMSEVFLGISKKEQIDKSKRTKVISHRTNMKAAELADWVLEQEAKQLIERNK